MKEKIMKNKYLIITLILVGVLAIFFLTSRESVEDKYKDMTDQEIIYEAFANMDALDTFTDKKINNRQSKDTGLIPNFYSESTARYDIKNSLIHAEFVDTLNGEDTLREYYMNKHNENYNMYIFEDNEWTLFEETNNGPIFTFDYFKNIMADIEYTSTREVNKLVIEIEYSYEDIIGTSAEMYTDIDADVNLKYTFENGYLTEVYEKEEGVYITEEVTTKFLNFNEHVSITVPEDALKLNN